MFSVLDGPVCLFFNLSAAAFLNVALLLVEWDGKDAIATADWCVLAAALESIWNSQFWEFRILYCEYIQVRNLFWNNNGREIKKNFEWHKFSLDVLLCLQQLAKHFIINKRMFLFFREKSVFQQPLYT